MLIRFLIIIFIIMLPAISLGQTVIEEAPLKPDGSSSSPGDEFVDASLDNDSVNNEDLRGADLDYGDLKQPDRINPEGGLIQYAWDDAPAEAGVSSYRYCDDCVYRVRTRELMVTTIVLPEDHKIFSIDIGDKDGYDFEIRYDSMITVRPTNFGIDTSMNVFTNYGVMSFYLRSESFDSENVPDIRVMIEGNNVLEKLISKYAEDESKKSVDRDLANLPLLESASDTSKSWQKKIGDDIAFDASSLRGWDDYTLWGDKSLEPETVFRDDYYTYISFDETWTDLDLPVAFVVFDGVDEGVNTKVEGRMLIVESTSPLIILKAGESFLCIEYGGE